MGKKILLLGSTGKMGTALIEFFGKTYELVSKNSRNFDAQDFDKVSELIKDNRPDIIINTVAFLGIDPCEQDSQKAFKLNTLFPKLLAELSNREKCILVHFSTDAVFGNKKDNFYVESDSPSPLNIYGFTKYGGDCFIQSIAKEFFIFRVSVLFGETQKDTQFVEKMLQKVLGGEKILRVSDDIISSPTYSRDVAREVKRILEEEYEFGIYHIANEGKASLYQLMKEIIDNLALDVEVLPVSYKHFPYLGIKNTYTPIKSDKIANLRHWKEAVKEYCKCIKTNYKKG